MFEENDHDYITAYEIMFIQFERVLASRKPISRCFAHSKPWTLYLLITPYTVYSILSIHCVQCSNLFSYERTSGIGNVIYISVFAWNITVLTVNLLLQS